MRLTLNNSEFDIHFDVPEAWQQDFKQALQASFPKSAAEKRPQGDFVLRGASIMNMDTEKVCSNATALLTKLSPLWEKEEISIQPQPMQVRKLENTSPIATHPAPASFWSQMREIFQVAGSKTRAPAKPNSASDSNVDKEETITWRFLHNKKVMTVTYSPHTPTEKIVLLKKLPSGKLVCGFFDSDSIAIDNNRKKIFNNAFQKGLANSGIIQYAPTACYKIHPAEIAHRIYATKVITSEDGGNELHCFNKVLHHDKVYSTGPERIQSLTTDSKEEISHESPQNFL